MARVAVSLGLVCRRGDQMILTMADSLSGEQHQLQINVLQYVPNVICTPTLFPPNPESCKPVLQTMPASDSTQIFGTGVRFGIDVLLPTTYADRKNCFHFFLPSSIVTEIATESVLSDVGVFNRDRAGRTARYLPMVQHLDISGSRCGHVYLSGSGRDCSH